MKIAEALSEARSSFVLGVPHSENGSQEHEIARRGALLFMRKVFMQIKRGIIQTFSPATYTASVLLFEATSYFLAGVPVANSIDRTSGLVGALCAVLFFDEHNPQDAVVLATFPNDSSGIPAPPPGRVVFVPGYQQLNAVSVVPGSPLTVTLIGVASGIPAGALGALCQIAFTSATAGCSLVLAPYGASNADNYAALGNLPAANATLKGNSLVALDSNGQITIQASGGTCSVTLFTSGYIA